MVVGGIRSNQLVAWGNQSMDSGLLERARELRYSSHDVKCAKFLADIGPSDLKNSIEERIVGVKPFEFPTFEIKNTIESLLKGMRKFKKVYLDDDEAILFRLEEGGKICFGLDGGETKSLNPSEFLGPSWDNTYSSPMIIPHLKRSSIGDGDLGQIIQIGYLLSKTDRDDLYVLGKMFSTSAKSGGIKELNRPSLIEYLIEDHRIGQDSSIIYLLNLLYNQRVENYLISVVNSNEHINTKFPAARILAIHGNKSAIPSLLIAMQCQGLPDMHSNVRRMAAFALGWLCESSSIKGLVEILNDTADLESDDPPEPIIYYENLKPYDAAIALALIGTDEAFAVLERGGSHAAAKALLKYGMSSLKKTFSRSDSKDNRTNTQFKPVLSTYHDYHLAKILGMGVQEYIDKHGIESLCKFLVEKYNSKDLSEYSFFKIGFLETLVEFAHPSSVVPMLANLLKDEGIEFKDRMFAAKALALRGAIDLFADGIDASQQIDVQSASAAGLMIMHEIIDVYQILEKISYD